MNRLLELRKKNQQRRLGESTKDSDISSQEADKEPKYIPTTIFPMKTSRELQSEHHSLPRDRCTQHVAHLERSPEIQMARMQLPACSLEQEIMEAIVNNDVVILCGET